MASTSFGYRAGYRRRPAILRDDSHNAYITYMRCYMRCPSPLHSSSESVRSPRKRSALRFQISDIHLLMINVTLR